MPIPTSPTSDVVGSGGDAASVASAVAAAGWAAIPSLAGAVAGRWHQ